MTNLTKNFTKKEFACKCGCGLDNISMSLVEMLQTIRDEWKKPLMINSGLRCKKHNDKSGGSPKSQHMLGTAADVRTEGNVQTFYNFIVFLYKMGKIPQLGYIQLYLDKNFVHLDVRKPKTRTVINL